MMDSFVVQEEDLKNYFWQQMLDRIRLQKAVALLEERLKQQDQAKASIRAENNGESLS